MAVIEINFKDTSTSDDEKTSSSSGNDDGSNETPSKPSNSDKSESEKSSGKSSDKSSGEATSGHSSDGKSSSSTSPSSNSKASTDGNTSDSSSGNSSGNSGDSQKEKHTKRRSQRSVGQILKDEDRKGKKPVNVDLTLTDDEDELENVKNSVDENEEAKKAKTKKIGEIMGKTGGNADKEFKIRDYVKSAIGKEDKEFFEKIRGNSVEDYSNPITTSPWSLPFIRRPWRCRYKEVLGGNPVEESPYYNSFNVNSLYFSSRGCHYKEKLIRAL